MYGKRGCAAAVVRRGRGRRDVRVGAAWRQCEPGALDVPGSKHRSNGEGGIRVPTAGVPTRNGYYKLKTQDSRETFCTTDLLLASLLELQACIRKRAEQIDVACAIAIGLSRNKNDPENAKIVRMDHVPTASEYCEKAPVPGRWPCARRGTGIELWL